jgi:hypothetical protein
MDTYKKQIKLTPKLINSDCKCQWTESNIGIQQIINLFLTQKAKVLLQRLDCVSVSHDSCHSEDNLWVSHSFRSISLMSGEVMLIKVETLLKCNHVS